MTDKKILDADELLHLAIEASNQNDSEKSIIYLKQALDLDSKNAKVHYLLGAMHAEIGMYERAIEDMQNAINLDPNLDTAHFQLGLLYITSGNVVAAQTAWAPLDKKGENDPLFLFTKGILEMANDNFEACIEDLSKGIQLNVANKPLNKDMENLITLAREALKNAAINEKPDKSSTDKHIFLSAYNADDN